MNLPVVIVRPSIVIGANSEPFPSWVEGNGGANGVTIWTVLGIVPQWVGDQV